MRFFQTIFASAALVAAAFAVEINEYPSSVQAGRTYRVTYTPGDDTPTTFILRKGENNNLDTITTLTESATGGEFMWEVDADLANADDYALEVQQPNSPPNYIGPIALNGGADVTSSAESSSASSTAASSTETESKTESSTETITSAPASTASGTPSSSSNGTATVSVTRTPSASPTGDEVPNDDSAAGMLSSSPLALLFGAVAAMVFLN